MASDVQKMAQMVGIDEQNMKLFLDLLAIEVKAGSTIEKAMENIHRLLTNLAAEAQKPEQEQADWFICLKKSLAADVYYAIRRQEAQRKIFAAH